MEQEPQSRDTEPRREILLRFVGDEVTRLKSLPADTERSEPSHVVSYKGDGARSVVECAVKRRFGSNVEDACSRGRVEVHNPSRAKSKAGLRAALQNLAENAARQGRAAARRWSRPRNSGRNDSRSHRLNHVSRCAAATRRGHRSAISLPARAEKNPKGISSISPGLAAPADYPGSNA